MKSPVVYFTRVLQRGGWLLGAVALAGCSSMHYADPINPSTPFAFPGQPGAPVQVAQAGSPQAGSAYPLPVPDSTSPYAPPPTQNTAPMPGPGHPLGPQTGRLHIGDMIIVTYSDTPNMIPEHKERIRDDGRITLPFNQSVVAAGKSPGEVQQDIRNALVPKYFRYLTAIVKTEDRYFFVGGEVKLSGRQVYLGEMTVLRAIESAQGFTDFAKRTKVLLTRASGEKITINCEKALNNPSLDLQVYAGDYIHVKKRMLF